MSDYSLVEDGANAGLMRAEPQLQRVFLASPSLRLTGPSDGVFSLELRSRVTALREALLDCGVRVFSSHHDQSWTARDTLPGPRVPSPHRAVASADAIVACVTSPLSSGVALELGWASALRKPIILLVDRAVSHSPLIAALEEVCPVMPLSYDSSWSSTSLRHILVTALGWADDASWPTAEELAQAATPHAVGFGE